MVSDVEQIRDRSSGLYALAVRSPLLANITRSRPATTTSTTTLRNLKNLRQRHLRTLIG